MVARNLVYDATSSARCVPKQRKRWPLAHHGGAGCSGNGERNAERDEPQNRLNRQLHRLSSDHDRVTVRQIGEMCSLQSQERSVQNEKCGRCKSRENLPLKAQCFPEYVAIAERPEPEHVHVIRQRRSTAKDNADKDGKNEKDAAAMATARRLYPRPVNGL